MASSGPLKAQLLQLRDAIFRRRFLFLFLALLLPYLIHPLIATEVVGIVLLDLAFSLVLIMGVFAVSDRKHLAVTALALVLLAQALTWTSHAVSNHLLILTGTAVNGLYLIYTAGLLLRHVIRSRAPTSNTIFAALCIYLLLGFIWAFVYSFLQDLDPGAFFFDQRLFNLPARGKHLFSELYYFIYFSFTTLTTLGFGDIMPASPWSRMLVSMEAVLGQLYLVVMVTYLIGLHINERQNAARKEPRKD